jgi:hypothetical protein
MGTGLVWIRTRYGEDCCEHCNEPSGSIPWPTDLLLRSQEGLGSVKLIFTCSVTCRTSFVDDFVNIWYVCTNVMAVNRNRYVLDSVPLGCDVASPGNWVQTFRGKVMPSSLRIEMSSRNLTTHPRVVCRVGCVLKLYVTFHTCV